jgi:hypothetical protein
MLFSLLAKTRLCLKMNKLKLIRFNFVVNCLERNENENEEWNGTWLLVGERRIEVEDRAFVEAMFGRVWKSVDG